MCFDKNCTPEVLSLFDITNGDCRTQCDTMYGWLNNGGISPSNKENLDDIKFETICGKS